MKTTTFSFSLRRSRLFICPCQLHFIKYQANKRKKCDDKYKQGVAVSLQEQTDSWNGWVAYSKLKKKKKTKAENVLSGLYVWEVSHPPAEKSVTDDFNAWSSLQHVML